MKSETVIEAIKTFLMISLLTGEQLPEFKPAWAKEKLNKNRSNNNKSIIISGKAFVQIEARAVS